MTLGHGLDVLVIIWAGFLTLILWALLSIYLVGRAFSRLSPAQKTAISTKFPKLWLKLYGLTSLGPNAAQFKRYRKLVKALAEYEKSGAARAVLDLLDPEDDEITLSTGPILPPVLPPSNRPPPPSNLVAKKVAAERYSITDIETEIDADGWSASQPKGKE